MDDLQNVIQDSLPDDVTPESLPEKLDVQKTQDDIEGSQPSSPEEATSKEAGKEPPFHEHPRWKEVQRQKEEALMRAAKAEAIVEYYKNLPEGKEVPKIDPASEFGISDDDLRTKHFVETIRKAAREEAVAVAKEYSKGIKEDIARTKYLTAEIVRDKFLDAYPDIRDNHELMAKAVAKYNAGYSLDDAAQLVLAPIKEKKYQEQLAGKERKQQGKTEKMAANLETSTIPPTSNVQPEKKKTIADFVDEYMKGG